MCGICGVLNSKGAFLTEKKVFQSLLWFSQTRGIDSTGTFNVTRSLGVNPPKTNFAKSLMPSSFELLRKDSKIMDVVNETGLSTIVGHCRSATKGAIKVENAHPFDFENIVGVHNGTVHTSFKGKDKFDTDSEGIYALLNELPVEEALNEIQSYASTNCAYALAFYDKRDHTMNFIKNSERPLHFSFLGKEQFLAFASEVWMLRAAAERFDLEMTSRDMLKEESDVFTLKENNLLKVPVSDMHEYTIEALDIKKKIYTSYKEPKNNHRAYYNWEDYDGTPWEGRESISESRTRSSFALEQYRTGYRGQQIHPLKWRSILDKGCCCCGTPQKPETLDTDVVWIDDSTFACPACKDTDWVQELAAFDIDSSITCN